MIKSFIIIRPHMRHHGIALWPFIFIHQQHAHNKELLNHEMIHLRQQLETGIIIFYALYITHYLINLAIYRHHHTAYRNICFEREAYTHQHNLQYLKSWHLYAWLRYIL